MSYLDAKGMLTLRERRRLFSLAQAVPVSGNILNVGVEYGASIVCLAEGAPTATIFGIDLDTTKIENLPNNKVVLMQIDSRLAVANWKTPLNLAFIDGDHGFEGVMWDTRFTRHIKVGGWVAFHDCLDLEGTGEVHPLVPGVNKAVTQWYRSVKNWDELEWTDSIRVFQRTK